MLPLWRDEVGILVSPTGLALTRMCRGVRPRRVAEEIVEFDAAEPAGWSAAVQALGRTLQQARWRNANARVVISDCWVRYALVPWQAQLAAESERLAHAWHVMSQTYGEMGADWRLAIADEPRGNPQLACAIPAGLLDAVHDLLAECQLRLLSMQPKLVVAFSRWRKVLPPGGCWFVSMESGSLAAANVSRRGWEQVRAVRIGGDWAAELRRLRTFGRLAAGQPGPVRVFVDAPYWVRKLSTAGAGELEMLDDSGGNAGDTLHTLLALKGMHP